MFCNLTSWAWHLKLAQAFPILKSASYLDDRSFRGPCSYDVLGAALRLTQRLDSMFGAQLNMSKSVWTSTQAKPRRMPMCLQNIPFKSSYTYLGVDIIAKNCHRASSKPRFQKRLQAVIQRATAICSLPASQRGATVCDAIASLYLSSGVTVYKTHIQKLEDKLATALRGSAHPRHKQRCRLAEHLMGCGVHRTHPAAAACGRCRRR